MLEIFARLDFNRLFFVKSLIDTRVVSRFLLFWSRFVRVLEYYLSFHSSVSQLVSFFPT